MLEPRCYACTCRVKGPAKETEVGPETRASERNTPWPWNQSQKVKRSQWKKHTLALKPELKKHSLPMTNSAQNPTNPWAQNSASLWVYPSSGIEIWPIPTLKMSTWKNSAPKKPYISPVPVQLGAAFFYPGRGSHYPGFLLPNKSLEWVLGEDLL